LADLDRAREEVVVQRAPDGKEWALRVLVADAGTDAGPRIDAAGEAAAVELVARPPAGGEDDPGAAGTSLGTLAVCPRKYWLQEQGREQSPRGNGVSKEIGTEVHELLAGTLVEGSAEAMRLAEVFRRSALGKRSAAASRVEREFDFVIAVE